MHLLLRKGLGVFLTAFTLLVSAEAQFFPTITIRLTDIPNNTKMCFTSTFSLAGTVTPFSPVYNTDFNFFFKWNCRLFFFISQSCKCYKEYKLFLYGRLSLFMG